MGGALARAACASLSPDRIIVANRTADKAEQLAAELGCSFAASNREAAESAQYLFLGVKPQNFTDLAAELIPMLNNCHHRGEDKVLVSMAAGLTLERLREIYADVDYDIPILRIMPNTCVAIGKGVIGLCGPEEAHLQAVEGILCKAGCVDRLPESLMDQFTSVAGCGPAFVYPFIEALADGGVMTGLPREKALRYAALTVLGAAAMVLETGDHPGALKDAVCSPGGSTIAGVAALEQEGLRSAAMEAVLASYRRNLELGK